MATTNDFTRGFQTNTALSAFFRVSISTNGYLSGYAGQSNYGVGILLQDLQGQSWEVAKVRLIGTGTQLCSVTANVTTPITFGTQLYLAAGGQLSTTGASTALYGVALQNSSSLGDVIEVLPMFTGGLV